MCFSVNVNLVKEELENRYGATLIDPDKYQPSYYYHAFGLPEIPAICSGTMNKISLLKWGLIPSWVKTVDDANNLMAEIHNSAKRMPVILGKTEENGWIDLSTSQADALSMLKPCSSEILKAHTISPLVNDKTASRNTPDVIRPYKYTTGNLLF